MIKKINDLYEQKCSPSLNTIILSANFNIKLFKYRDLNGLLDFCNFHKNADYFIGFKESSFSQHISFLKLNSYLITVNEIKEYFRNINVNK
jgi:hypothetical protein